MIDAENQGANEYEAEAKPEESLTAFMGRSLCMLVLCFCDIQNITVDFLPLRCSWHLE